MYGLTHVFDDKHISMVVKITRENYRKIFLRTTTEKKLSTKKISNKSAQRAMSL